MSPLALEKNRELDVICLGRLGVDLYTKPQPIQSAGMNRVDESVKEVI